MSKTLTFEQAKAALRSGKRVKDDSEEVFLVTIGGQDCLAIPRPPGVGYPIEPFTVIEPEPSREPVKLSEEICTLTNAAISGNGDIDGHKFATVIFNQVRDMIESHEKSFHAPTPTSISISYPKTI